MFDENVRYQFLLSEVGPSSALLLSVCHEQQLHRVLVAGKDCE